MGGASTFAWAWKVGEAETAAAFEEKGATGELTTVAFERGGGNIGGPTAAAAKKFACIGVPTEATGWRGLRSPPHISQDSADIVL